MPHVPAPKRLRLTRLSLSTKSERFSTSACRGKPPSMSPTTCGSKARWPVTASPERSSSGVAQRLIKPLVSGAFLQVLRVSPDSVSLRDEDTGEDEATMGLEAVQCSKWILEWRIRNPRRGQSPFFNDSLVRGPIAGHRRLERLDRPQVSWAHAANSAQGSAGMLKTSSKLNLCPPVRGTR
jgi:hypothetical protein